MFYPKHAVDSLAEKIGDFARATTPPAEQAPTAPRMATSAPVQADAVKNRRVIETSDIHHR